MSSVSREAPKNAENALLRQGARRAAGRCRDRRRPTSEGLIRRCCQKVRTGSPLAAGPPSAGPGLRTRDHRLLSTADDDECRGLEAMKATCAAAFSASRGIRYEGPSRLRNCRDEL